MRTILVLNAKGGCGKTTIATTLAAHYAARGHQVALADLDPQASAWTWLEARPETRPPIHGIAAWEGAWRAPRGCEVLVMDAPARVHGAELAPLLRRAETVLIPVLPSPLDIRAAARFVGELTATPQVARGRVVLGVLANRVREHTRIYHTLEDFLRRLGIPFIGVLRESQNYIRAAERGLGVLELAPAQAAQDREQWQRLLRWLGSRRSRPAA
ncbi:AAA family ATPase [Inmirania thermothiophila]|uniref:Chromosome partitioning protein n=1 Tax=Inmirania thermothiophila TaxID=1750597 RepID=A0A3N1Y6E3_9GAMM|nr:AAA family ATPase [Inmirania thermothiophila]ROR34384.1 chromosome partitioning protein [Inmirania thermothiophila]